MNDLETYPPFCVLTLKDIVTQNEIERIKKEFTEQLPYKIFILNGGNDVRLQLFSVNKIDNISFKEFEDKLNSLLND